MTNVIFNVFEETSKGDKPVKYSIVAKRAKRRIEDGKIYTLTPIREDGFYGKILELESTSLGEAWIITVSTSNDTLNGYYKIPDVNEILFTELIKVDPESLEPDATPDPEWWEVAKATINGGIVNAEGDLILTRSDGVKVNAGHVEGEPGKPGQDGVSVKGDPGKDGAGIGDAFITGDGDLELVRTDGVVFTPGRVVGHDGEPGEPNNLEIGVIEFIPGAPGAVAMRVDTSVGTRVFISDGTTEHMVKGDTGWRNISSLVKLETTGSLIVLIRRVNERVYLSVEEMTVPVAPPAHATILTVPVGYQPYPVMKSGPQYEISSNLYSSIRDIRSGTLGAGTKRFQIVFPTRDVWPITLPGIPA